jgi:hypothetical protein
MDHIPSVQNSTVSPVLIPYIGDVEYDGGDFHGYPARMGWDDSEFTVRKFYAKHTAGSFGGFLQTWLYFGMLHEYLQSKEALSEYVRSDDVHGLVLTTRSLRSHVTDWKDRFFSLDVDGKKRSLSRLNACFSSVHYWIVAVFPEEEFAHILTPEIRLGIQILAESLHATKRLLVSPGADDLPGDIAIRDFGTSELLDSRVAQSGWCPNEFSRMCNVDRYTASSVIRRPQKELHQYCTSTQCIANNIDEATYETKHTRPDCNCPFLWIPPGPIGQILQDGGIPILAIAIRPDGVMLKMVAHTPGMKYVAISHVWADGLGKVDANALPYCQYAFLQQLASAIFTDPSTPSYVWIDTLCVPHVPEWRKIAIRRLKDTYRLAEKVIALDSHLRQFKWRDTPPEVISTLLCGSSWFGRVWTLQEAVLGSDLAILLADCLVNIDLLIQRALENPFLEVTSRFIRGLSREVQAQNYKNLPLFLYREFCHRATSKMGDRMICFATLCGLNTDPLFDEENLTERLKLLLDQLGALNKPTPSLDTSATISRSERHELDVPRRGWLSALWESMKERLIVRINTSNVMIRVIMWAVMSTKHLLTWSTAPQSVTTGAAKSQIPDDAVIGWIPECFVWSLGPRMPENGWRWAPADLTGVHSNLVGPFLGSVPRTPDGVLVRRLGFIFPRSVVDSEYAFSFVDPLTFNRRVCWTMVAKGDWNGWSWEDVGADEKTKVVLIFPQETAGPDDRGRFCVLASLYKDEAGIKYVRYKCQARTYYTTVYGIGTEVSEIAPSIWSFPPFGPLDLHWPCPFD